MHLHALRSSLILLCAALFPTVSAHPETSGLPEVDIHAPYVSTPYPVVDAMLTLAHVGPSDLLIDMGCGDGRIAIQAAKRYGAHAIGVDINPERIAEAKENAKRAGVEHLVRFEERNVFDTDVRSATVVAMYLLQNIQIKLRPALRSQLKPGARIVSHTFDMGAWKPTRTKSVGSDSIFLWELPGK